MSDQPKHSPTRLDLHAHRDEIWAIAERYKADQVCVLGSVACGDAPTDRDVDLLVTFRE